MVGLLVKDIQLLVGQKKFFVSVILISVLFVISGQDPMFVVNYATMLCAFFTISTISYDEFNHGYSFLFTLPISRKGYVLEKYLYGLLVGGVAWLVSAVFGVAYNSLTGVPVLLAEWLGGAAAALVILGIFLSVTLPVQLKYGADRGRTVMFIITVVVFGGLGFFIKNEEMVSVLSEKLRRIKEIGHMAGLWMGAFAFVLVVAVSIFISIRIVEKKEF